MGIKQITGTIEEILADVKSYSKEKGIALFYSSDLEIFFYDAIPDEYGVKSKDIKPIVFAWDDERGDHREYINTMIINGVKLLYVEVGIFSFQEDLLEEFDNGEDASGNIPNDLRKKIDSFKDYDGKLKNIVLGYVHDAVWHKYEKSAEWREEYLNLIPDEKEDAGESKEGDTLAADYERKREERENRAKELTEYQGVLAKDLANDKGYFDLSIEARRLWILDRISKDKKAEILQMRSRLQRNVVEKILAQAEHVFRADVAPRCWPALMEKARKVFQGEWSDRNIGKYSMELGVTPKALREAYRFCKQNDN